MKALNRLVIVADRFQYCRYTNISAVLKEDHELKKLYKEWQR